MLLAQIAQIGARIEQDFRQITAAQGLNAGKPIMVYRERTTPEAPLPDPLDESANRSTIALSGPIPDQTILAEEAYALALSTYFSETAPGAATYTAEQEVEIDAFVYHVAGTSAQRRFAELESGDLLLDVLDTDLDLSGKTGVYFKWQGVKWVQKAVGKDVTEHFDMTHRGTGVIRTLVLQRSK